MKDLTIACPHCGKEYLPVEIFLPNNFFGKSFNIVRDENDNLMYCDDIMDLQETFICERCSSKFSISTEISFTVKSCDTTDFNEDYKKVIKYNKY